jgi:hypothetical protein
VDPLGAYAGRHTRIVLGICHLRPVNEKGVEVNSVYRIGVGITAAGIKIGGASHQKLACWYKHFLADIGRGFLTDSTFSLDEAGRLQKENQKTST